MAYTFLAAPPASYPPSLPPQRRDVILPISPPQGLNKSGMSVCRMNVCMHECVYEYVYV